MSRSQFILGIALLVVSATLAFTISYRHEDAPSPDSVANIERASSTPSRVRQIRPYSPSDPSSRKDRTFYEVTVSDRKLSTVATIVEEESRQKLDALTERYKLTTSQRRSIFPQIASRHPEYQEGLIINGSTIPSQIATTSLDDAIYPFLDEDQQEEFEDDALANNEWWNEIITQLRDDLDQAISEGEMIPTTDPIRTSDQPAPGDGETIENPDIDLNNLFGK